MTLVNVRVATWAGKPTRSTSSSMPQPVSTSAPITTARRSLPTTAPHSHPTRWALQPSTVPGCRTPHLSLAGGKSLYDAVGPEFTLLRLDAGIDVGPLTAAAAMRRVPLQVLDIEAGHAADLRDHRLVLSRPDQHVAWRGDALPPDPLDLIDRVRGA